MSYPDIPMGDVIDPMDMPVHNKPTATQHYAGDVIQLPPSDSPNTGPAVSSPYAFGQRQDPKIQSIGEKTLKNWIQRRTGK